MRFYLTDFEGAVAAAEPAIDQLVRDGEFDRACVALTAVVHAIGAASGGRRARALPLLERFLARIPEETPTLVLPQTAYAFTRSMLGQVPEADVEFERARQLPGASAPAFSAFVTANRAFFVSFPRGEFESALDGLSSALLVFGDPANDPAALAPFAHWMRGLVLDQLGRAGECMAEAQGAEAAADRLGVRELHQTSFSWLRSLAFAARGEWQPLGSEVHQSAPFYAPGGPGVGLRYHHEALVARFAAGTGDRDAALAAAGRARELARHSANPFELALTLTDVALPLHDLGAFGLAREFAQESAEIARRLAFPWFEARCELALSAMARDESSVDDNLARALELTESHGYAELWSRRERPRAAVLLARALRAELGPTGTAERLLGACGGEVLTEGAELLSGAPAPARAALARAAARAADSDAVMVARLASDRDPEVRRPARSAQATLARRPRPPLRIVTFGALPH